MKPLLQIAYLTDGPKDADLSRPWAIVETSFKDDFSMRTKVIDGWWSSEAEAKAVLRTMQGLPPKDHVFRLHPAGDFDGKFIEFGSANPMKSKSGGYYVSAKFETVHGVLHVTISGLPESIMWHLKCEKRYAGMVLRLRVKHETYKGATRAFTHVRWEDSFV